MGRNSVVMDRGRETCTVYPEKRIMDSRGNSKLIPDLDNPITVRVSAETDRQSDAELPGQVSSKVLNLFTRTAPVTSWVEVLFRDEFWDVAKPPTKSVGISKATDHWMFQIRSRNQDVPGSDI